jgi:enolase
LGLRRKESRLEAKVYRNFVSHRSGETEDTFIADLTMAHRRRPHKDRFRLPQ